MEALKLLVSFCPHQPGKLREVRKRPIAGRITIGGTDKIDLSVGCIGGSIADKIGGLVLFYEFLSMSIYV